MLDGVTYGDTKGKQDDLGDGEERGAEDDVSNRPSVLKCAEDKDKLRDDVDNRANERPQDVDDPKPYGLRVLEACKLLERGDGDEEAHSEHRETGDSQELRVYVWSIGIRCKRRECTHPER